MGWIDQVSFSIVEHSKIPSLSFQSRQDPRVRGETRHYYINGVQQERTYTVWVPYEQEQRRWVKTVTETTVSEAVGLTRAAAQSYGQESGQINAGTEEWSSTYYTSQKMNDADGWKVVKIQTTVTVTRGQWMDYNPPPAG